MSHKNKDIPIGDIKKIASRAIAFYNINSHYDLFSESEIESICATGQPDIFTDSVIINNDVVLKKMRWDKVRPRRLCALIPRLMDMGYETILKDINMSKLNMKIKDLRSLLIRKPHMVKTLGIDLNTISDTDAYSLLVLGKEYFLEHIPISKRRFGPNQQYNICKAYGFKRPVMEKFDCKKFDGFHVAEILSSTGMEHVDLLDVRSMKLIEWISLVSEHPNMYVLCEPMRFSGAPISQLIDLAVLTDDQVLYDIIMRSSHDDISPFGWEKLMSNRPDMFSSVCDYNKLNAMNKRNVVVHQPHLGLMMNL